jgi:hypothetical protein
MASDWRGLSKALTPWSARADQGAPLIPEDPSEIQARQYIAQCFQVMTLDDTRIPPVSHCVS